MKVFEFHPETGTIGKLLEERKRAGWADCSFGFLHSKGETGIPAYRLPQREGAEFGTHIDAGIEDYCLKDGITFVSYKHDTKWLAFCIGQMTRGEDEGVWDWWIIPSKEAYPITDTVAQDYQSWRDGK